MCHGESYMLRVMARHTTHICHDEPISFNATTPLGQIYWISGKINKTAFIDQRATPLEKIKSPGKKDIWAEGKSQPSASSLNYIK